MFSKQKQSEKETGRINTFRGRGRDTITGLTLEWDRMSGGHGRLFALQQCRLHLCVQYIFVRLWETCSKMRVVLCTFQGLCKAVSVDIASMEERFLHSLRYTLINLLKPSRPVSSTLTHQKSQAALNPTRIFSMDASGKSLRLHSWHLSVRVCRNAYKVQTNIHLIISLLMDVSWGGSCHKGSWNPSNNRVVCCYCLSASSAYWIVGTSVANRWGNSWSVVFFQPCPRLWLWSGPYTNTNVKRVALMSYLME